MNYSDNYIFIHILLKMNGMNLFLQSSDLFQNSYPHKGEKKGKKNVTIMSHNHNHTHSPQTLCCRGSNHDISSSFDSSHHRRSPRRISPTQSMPHKHNLLCGQSLINICFSYNGFVRATNKSTIRLNNHIYNEKYYSPTTYVTYYIRKVFYSLPYQ